MSHWVKYFEFIDLFINQHCYLWHWDTCRASTRRKQDVRVALFTYCRSQHALLPGTSQRAWCIPDASIIAAKNRSMQWLLLAHRQEIFCTINLNATELIAHAPVAQYLPSLTLASISGSYLAVPVIELIKFFLFVFRKSAVLLGRRERLSRGLEKRSV